MASPPSSSPVTAIICLAPSPTGRPSTRSRKKASGSPILHYALDPGKEFGPYLLDWIGGYYEQFWSVNPSWQADFKALPGHPITRGVKPFQVSDEWYYHMRFVEGMAGVTPILSAVPPDSTRKGPDGPHSGNAEVRARLGMAEHVAWAYERPATAAGASAAPAATRIGSTPRMTSAS